MDLISLKRKRKLITILLLCVGFISSYPFNATASPDDTPVLKITQGKQQAKRTVTGTVVDASTGEELIGVNIRIKGTNLGTVTDADGKFSISVEGRKAELQFTYIGYKEQIVEVGDLGVLNIKMQSDNEMLDEIVVIGAGTQKKISISGAIATVEGAVLKTPTSSLTNSLAGKLAGVISTISTGEPG